MAVTSLLNRKHVCTSITCPLQAVLCHQDTDKSLCVLSKFLLCQGVKEEKTVSLGSTEALAAVTDATRSRSDLFSTENIHLRHQQASADISCRP